MKAVTSENSNAFSTGVYGSSGKISKHSSTSHRKDVENEEIRVYLSKLKELVPFMPKNRKLSKLEVIQYVIDYIYDLQYALETHPTLNSAAVHSAAAAMLSAQSQPQVNTVSPVHRQPLGVLPPNANIQVTANATNCVNSSCSSPESNVAAAVSSSRTIVSEKVSSPSPVTSCSSTESATSTVLQC